MLTKATRSIPFAIAAVALASSAGPAEAYGQEYAGEGQKVVAKVIEAHGGMALWDSAATVSYQHVLFDPAAAKAGEGSPWWVSNEIVDQERRRTHQSWPLEHAVLVDDGQRVWTVNWSKGNAPREMARAHYYLLFMPWLTQDPYTSVGAPGTGQLPGDPVAATTVDVTFSPDHPDRAGQTVTLFVDQENHLLRGIAYEVKGRKIAHRFSRYGSADGLRVPVEFTTIVGGADVGFHFVHDLSLRQPWNDTRMAMPPNAVVHSEVTVTPPQ